MTIMTVAIRVELPAYSSSFDVQVPESATVLDIKHAISSGCIGHPQPEGQRVIWRGRYLDDQEKISELWPCQDDQRTVHLSVRPSAWMGDPPGAGATTSSSSPSCIPPYPAEHSSPTKSLQHSFSTTPPTSDPNDSFAFVRFKHSQALCWLSNFKMTAPSHPDDARAKQRVAKLALERLGYAWPNILDAAPPLAGPVPASALDYEIATINGKAYLSLRTPRGIPSLLQVHALNVLTCTFSILSLPPSRPPPTPTPSTPNTQPVPPHVNDLLRELGLPHLRVVPHANIDVNVQQDTAGTPAVPEHAEGNMREIPVRALLAPLLMVVFRTALLLYFFSPTRKPLLGLCLIAWIIYEMWTHVRIVILRPLDRAGGNVAGLDRNGAQAGDGVPNGAPVAQGNGRAGDGNLLRPTERGPNTEATRDGQQVQGPPIPRQSNGIIDSVSLANVHGENKLLWPLQWPTITPEQPTFLHKAISFCSLLVVSLHPEVYNRRRVALRQRESRLRTEMNSIERSAEARSIGDTLSEEEQRKDAFRRQLQGQHAQRAVWVKRYVERVRQDDWIEE